MKKYLLYIAIFAVGLTTSCSDGINNPDGDKPGKKDPQYVQFGIQLPGGDPIIYTRSGGDGQIQNILEKEVKQLDIYMFNGTTGLLEAIYDDVTLTASSTGYSITIQVDGTVGRDFLFIANNMKNTATRVAIPSVIGTTTKNDVKAVTTLSIASSAAYIVPPLVMTAELTNVVPGTPAPTARLERIMARFDIRNYEYALTITSFEFQKTYDQAKLFGTGTGYNTISFNDRTMPTVVNAQNQLVQLIDMGTHKHLRHIIYTYPAPPTVAPTAILRGFVTTNSGDVPVEYTIPLKPKGSNDYIDVKRNYRYTIVINRSISGVLGMDLVVNEWENEEFTYIFSSEVPSISFAGMENGATFANNTMTVDNTAFTYNLAVDPQRTDWSVTYGNEGAATSTDFSLTGWITAAPGKSSGTVQLNDKLSLAIEENTTGNDRDVFIRISCKADPHKFYEFKVVQKG